MADGPRSPTFSIWRFEEGRWERLVRDLYRIDAERRAADLRLMFPERRYEVVLAGEKPPVI